jgi:hypothetical protein
MKSKPADTDLLPTILKKKFKEVDEGCKKRRIT